jgi:hypothetical protein
MSRGARAREWLWNLSGFRSRRYCSIRRKFTHRSGALNCSPRRHGQPRISRHRAGVLAHQQAQGCLLFSRVRAPRILRYSNSGQHLLWRLMVADAIAAQGQWPGLPIAIASLDWEGMGKLVRAVVSRDVAQWPSHGYVSLPRSKHSYLGRGWAGGDFLRPPKYRRLVSPQRRAAKSRPMCLLDLRCDGPG